jgi:hypothetical protein
MDMPDEAPPGMHCVACGAPIDATDSVRMADGPTCLACVETAARQGAMVLARRHHLQRLMLWSTASVLGGAGSRIVADPLVARVLSVAAAVALVLAMWSIYRARRTR